MFYKELYREVFGRNGFGEAAVEHLQEQTGIFNDFYINFDRILLSANFSLVLQRTQEDIYRKVCEKALRHSAEKWGSPEK